MIPKTKLRKLNKPLPSYDYCLRHSRNKILWNEISNRHDLTYDFIREFKDSINWRCISGSANLVLSPDFISEFDDRLTWSYISAYKNLELDDYRRYKEKLYWGNVCRNQKMSEQVLREFREDLDWNNVSVDWINNISSGGTFVCPKSLSKSKERFPKGWSVKFK